MKTYFKIFFLLTISGLIVACSQSKGKETESIRVEAQTEPAIKSGMIKVTILYPNGEGKTFDMDYYVNNHMKMVANLAGDSIKAMSIEKGIAGGASEAPVPYLAIGNMYFDNISAFQNSLGPHSDKLVADIVNFTNCEPILQISLVQFAE